MCFILFGIGVVLGCVLLIGSEISGAKTFCKSVDGNYSIKKFNHNCNGLLIIRTDTGWIFDKDFGEDPFKRLLMD